MLCLICPTAAAAGVITGKLGGSLSDTVSYVVLINISVAVILPVAIPIVNLDTGTTFLEGFTAICARVFPLLVLPQQRYASDSNLSSDRGEWFRLQWSLLQRGIPASSTRQ